MKRNFIGAFVGSALLLTSPSLFATIIGTGSLTILAPGYGPDQAGPYSVSAVVVSSGVNPGSSFQTFCLGSQVDYTPGPGYTYQISDIVEPSGAPPGGVGAPGYVTWGTAWLYSQYLGGTLPGYSGTVNGLFNDALQEAIWTLQKQTFNGIGLTLSAAATADPTDLANDLNALLGAAVAAATADNIAGGDGSNANGAFGVYALDLLTGPNTYAQPQLVMVPVPEPSTMIAGALMVVPFLGGAVRGLRRERAA